MNSKILSSASSASANRMTSGPTSSPFAQRFTTAAAVRARFPAPSPGRLIDPYLLDRLQVPLTRYRD
jgi:hypothetical protein